MTSSHFSGLTLDDIMRSVVEEIYTHGSRISPGKGAARELSGVLLELTNPRARLSRSETRGKPFSCLGELCWYLAKSDDLEFISYYLPKYAEAAYGGRVFGAYGPRLFAWKGLDQFANVTRLLGERRDSRRAVIQLFDAHDIVGEHSDVPCTCTLQFILRAGILHMLTSMRSNDVFLGLPHDVFCFTMLQEIMARTLSVEIGTYKHVVGSLHLYDEDAAAAQQFLDEGWQSTTPMPPMPLCDPWRAIALLLEGEAELRARKEFNPATLDDIDPYWADLVYLLQILRLKREKDKKGMSAVRARMSSNVYLVFIDQMVNQLQ